ncbi:MAG: HEAT repeat domain-containing protein [Gemmatales bacterium]|nr:hypothetical protein [Gemmatales bacterium]MDW7994961.1 HEAT repeat domain-containing protein [Gemmatales bacterium]
MLRSDFPRQVAFVGNVGLFYGLPVLIGLFLPTVLEHPGPVFAGQHVRQHRECVMLRHLVGNPMQIDKFLKEKAQGKMELDLRKWAETMVETYEEEFKKDIVAAMVFEGILPCLLTVDTSGICRHVWIKYLETNERGELPNVESVESKAAIAHRLLKMYDQINNMDSIIGLKSRPADSYPTIIAEYQDKIPDGLVEYLYENYKQDAWHWFHKGVTAKSQLNADEFDWAAHVLETTAWRIRRNFRQHADVELARTKLERLVNDKAWYIRRYAVHVLIKYPFFRTPELVKKLQNDPHPLVRDRAKHIKLDNK